MILFGQNEQHQRYPSQRILNNENKYLNTNDSLDSFFSTLMTTYHIPGMSACIIHNDSILWLRNYGYADILNNKLVTDSTIFILASVSKTIVVTALIQLYEQGKFNLDDSVNAYLPFKVSNPNFPSLPITFRMLIKHTSSIQDNWNAWPQPPGDYPMALGTYLQQYFTPGGIYYNSNLNFYHYPPGSTWNYSNIGAALVGYLVQIISGSEFDKYCKDSIFIPLQMSNTAWFLKDLNTSLIARPYTYSSGTFVDRGLYGFPMYPCGQLRATILSLANFLKANINYGASMGKRILDSVSVRMIRTVYVPSIFDGLCQGGFIWWKENFTGHGLWGHDGALEGAGTAMYLSETDKTGVIYLMNTDHDFAIESAVVSRLIDEAHKLIVGVNDHIADIPRQFVLQQNYPNPFNPTTKISWQTPVRDLQTLKVYDVLGREVRILVNEEKEAGYHSIDFHANDLPSGVYFYQLNTGEFTATRKMILVK